MLVDSLSIQVGILVKKKPITDRNTNHADGYQLCGGHNVTPWQMKCIH